MICNKMTVILKSVRFEILTAMVMNSSIFWDITPCSPLKVNRRFRGISSESKNRPNRKPASSTCYLLQDWLIFRPRKWKRYVSPKRRLTFNGLYGIISQKTETLILKFACQILDTNGVGSELRPIKWKTEAFTRLFLCSVGL
jgi:hypothetical protein